MSLPWPSHTTEEWEALLAGRDLAAWEEELHPRDKEGQFAPKGGEIGGGGMPPNLGKRLIAALKEAVGPVKIQTFKTQREVTESIDSYLMKHYGITTSGQAKALVDRDKRVGFAHDTPEELAAALAHMLPDMTEESHFQEATPGQSPEQRQQSLADAITGAFFSEPAQQLMELSNPLGALVSVLHHRGML